MSTVLSRQTFLAQFIWRVDEDALFSYGDEDKPQFLRLGYAEWWDMGKPETITVTIQPGDLLNNG